MSRVRRFLVEESGFEATEATEGRTGAPSHALITGDELKHLRSVLRLKEGDAVSVLDGRGNEWRGVIENLGMMVARVRIIEKAEGEVEAPLRVRLLAALTKGTKPEFTVEKATELGATDIVFYSAERSVAILKGEDKDEKKLKRLNKVALSALKQCGRRVLPKIGLARNLDEAVATIEGIEGGIRIVLHKGEAGGASLDLNAIGDLKVIDLKEALGGLKGNDKDGGLTILIGPEGGLTEAELEQALGAGFISASLGPRTLRSETAAIAALAVVQSELGRARPR